MTRRSTQSGVTLIEVLIAVTLLSLLSVGMLFAMRVGLSSMGKTNDRITSNRRALGVEKILSQQIAGFIPTVAVCGAGAEGPRIRVAYFQGDTQTMRFVSTYSLQEAARGYARMLEFQVVPGENGRGVRLIVNEFLYSGAFGTAGLCLGMAPDPLSGVLTPLWRPVQAGPASFVLADKLAACQFAYKEEKPGLREPDVWHDRWRLDGIPAAVRVQLAPLEPDPAQLQVPSVVAPFRVTRKPLEEVKEEGQ